MLLMPIPFKLLKFEGSWLRFWWLPTLPTPLRPIPLILVAPRLIFGIFKFWKGMPCRFVMLGTLLKPWMNWVFEGMFENVGRMFWP